MSLSQKIKHLYPGIQDEQFLVENDGSGDRLVYLDPILGDHPDQATLDDLDSDPAYQTFIAREEAKRGRHALAESGLAQYAQVIKTGQDITKVQTWVANNFPSLTAPEQAALSKVIHIVALAVRSAFHDRDDFFNGDE